MDKFIVVASLALVVVVFGLIGAMTFGAPAAPAGSQYTADDAIAAARQFVSAEKTFTFDGMADTLNVRMNKTVSDSAYEVIAEFTSRHAGFGDRADKMVAEVITNHRATLLVEKNAVISAVMDGEWDMITQKMIEATETLPATMPASNPYTVIPGTAPEGAQL